MTPLRRQLPAWSTLSLVAAGVVLVVALVFAYALAGSLLQRVAQERARLVVAAFAGHLESTITRVHDDLAWTAAALPLPPRPLGEEGGSILVRARERLARVMRCVTVVEPDGSVAAARPSCPADEMAVKALVGRARERCGQPATQVVLGESGGHVLLTAVTAAGAAGGSEGRRVVLAAVDVSALLGGLPDVRASAAADVLFVSLAGSSPAYRVGSAGEAHPIALAALLPGDDSGVVRDALMRGELVQGFVLLTQAGRRQRHFLVVERREIAGQTWMVGALLPGRPAAGEGRTLQMAGIALSVALLAALVAVGVGLRRVRAGPGGGLDGAWPPVGGGGPSSSRALVERMPEPALLVTGGVVEAVNAEVRRLFDWRTQGPARDFVGQFDSRDRAQIERALQLGQAAESVARVHLANGEARTVKLRMAPLGDDAMLVTVQDRTTVERAEALLRAVSGAVPLGLVFTDRRGRLLWASAACRERTGYPLEQYVGEDLLFLVEREDHRRARALLARGARGSGIRDHLRVRCASGEVITVAAHVVPVTSSSMGPVGVLFLCRELDVRRATAEQGQRAETLGHLSRALAGRLNNDFQALFGVLSRLDESSEVGAVREQLSRMLAGAAEELQRFVVVGRTSGGHLGPLHLSSLVERWFTRMAPSIPERLRFRLRAGVGADRVLVDDAQLALVLDLYLAEAQTALSHCDGAIEVAVEPGPKPGEVVVSVSRTLVEGKPATTEATDSLVQVYSAREAALAVAELVASRHGGSAGLRDRAGLEACFWLALPVLRGREGESRHQVGVARWGPVVVADDEEMVRATLAGSLRAEGLEVVETNNGEEAVEAVQARPGYFALAVLDLVMPVLDGRGALLRLREIEPGLPVLLCTGYDPEPDEALATADLIIKPFRLEEFVARVRTLMGRGPATPA